MTARTRTILIVDDDTDFAAALASFLGSHGFRVLEARDGRQGLRLAKLERPDLILMDIIMNERTEGLFTVQEMRRTPGLESVPIFVLSSLYSTAPDFQVQPDGGWMAHDEFLPKPVSPAQLLIKIRDRIGGLAPVEGGGE